MKYIYCTFEVTNRSKAQYDLKMATCRQNSGDL